MDWSSILDVPRNPTLPPGGVAYRAAMATLQECQDALEQLAGQLTSTDPSDRRATEFERTLNAHVPDLGVTFAGRLSAGTLVGIAMAPAPPAQIRLTADSDDLVALARGALDLGRAWLSGRIKIQAGVRDLLRLCAMF